MKLSRVWLIGCGLCWTGLTLLSAGCQTAKKDTTQALPTGTGDEIKILYRIDSDRLNVAGNRGAQLVAFQPQQSLLPNCTLSTLTIRYPHPQGLPSCALVTVSIRPRGEHAATSNRSLLNKLSLSETKTVESNEAMETWAMEVPKWQLDAVIAKLKEQNFFRRSRVLDSEVFLSAQVNELALGKDYRPIAELDAMIIQIRSQGRLIHRASWAAGPIAPSVASLPPNPMAPQNGPWPAVNPQMSSPQVGLPACSAPTNPAVSYPPANYPQPGYQPAPTYSPYPPNVAPQSAYPAPQAAQPYPPSASPYPSAY